MHQRRNGSAQVSKANENVSNTAKLNMRGRNDHCLVPLLRESNMEKRPKG